PLGMARTTFRPTTAMTYPLALGHQPARAGRPAVVRPFADNAATWPAGSMFSNVHDLGRFAVAFLNDGRLDGKPVLAPELIKTLAGPYVDVPGGTRYGYGLTSKTVRGVTVLEHGGA